MSMVSYPVDLVEIIRLQHDATDDASAWGCFHGDGDFTEEDVEVCLDGGCLTLLVDCELGAVRACLDVAGSCSPLI